MSDRRTAPLWVPFVLALALALGWLGGRAGSRAAAVDDGNSNARLADEMRALREFQERTADVLADLRNALSEFRLAPAGPPASREPVRIDAGPAQALAELAQALEAVRSTFERESSETQALIRSSPVFGGERLVEVRDRRRDPDWSALETLEKTWRVTPQDADRSQYFQTPRDLLEAYGPPTAIYRPKDGLLFHYRRHPEGSPGPSLYFRLQDGIVIEFYVEDDDS